MLFPYNFIPDKAEFFFIHGIAEKKRKQELKYYMLKVSTITFEQCSQTIFLMLFLHSSMTICRLGVFT